MVFTEGFVLSAWQKLVVAKIGLVEFNIFLQLFIIFCICITDNLNLNAKQETIKIRKVPRNI